MLKTASWRFAALGLVAVLATGCGSTSDTTMADMDAHYEEQQMKLEELRAEVAKQEEARLAAEEAARDAKAEAERLANAASSSSGSSYTSTAGTALLPPAAKSGECYARVLIPPVYETQTERVLVREADQKISVEQPKFDWAQETVKTKEASYKLEVVPAKYEWVEERVMTKPSRKELRVVPATYKTETEKALVSPERTYWKRGRGPIEKIDNATGEIMCLITEPARYETVTKQVVATPERVEEVEIPAEYTTVKRMVVTEEATTRRVEIPAEFSEVKVLKQVDGPDQKVTEIPAEYKTVTKQVMAKESYLEWRPVICETNMSGDFIVRLQSALQDAGHNPGPIDGVYGSQTRAAVNAFQVKNNLATGGLTTRTVEKLGL